MCIYGLSCSPLKFTRRRWDFKSSAARFNSRPSSLRLPTTADYECSVLKYRVPVVEHTHTRMPYQQRERVTKSTIPRWGKSPSQQDGILVGSVMTVRSLKLHFLAHAQKEAQNLLTFCGSRRAVLPITDHQSLKTNHCPTFASLLGSLEGGVAIHSCLDLPHNLFDSVESNVTTMMDQSLLAKCFGLGAHVQNTPEKCTGLGRGTHHLVD